MCTDAAGGQKAVSETQNWSYSGCDLTEVCCSPLQVHPVFLCAEPFFHSHEELLGQLRQTLGKKCQCYKKLLNILQAFMLASFSFMYFCGNRLLVALFVFNFSNVFFIKISDFLKIDLRIQNSGHYQR